MNYFRNGRMNKGKLKAVETPVAEEGETQGKEKGVRVNGFRQVVELLAVADPEFRASLLQRIAKQDPKMASSLKSQLTLMGL